MWGAHVVKLRREKKFARYYRMDEDAFDHLVAILQPDLQVDARMSTRRTGEAPISAEVVLHCTIRWLAGGSYLDISDVGCISIPSFYRCLSKGIGAIVACAELSFTLPRTPEKIEQAAAEFAQCSTDRVFDGCVGCIDGVLIRIKTPSASETGNVRSYFSGHCHTIGLNVQAVCDSKSRFIFFAVAAPGSSSDIRALRQTSLLRYADSLPTGRYFIGDCPYVPSEHMLTPFGGSQKAIPANDHYNFYLSQLRIKIEQAFGLMTTKWRRLRSPLQVRLKTAPTVCVAIARLHNYCIDHRQYSDSTSIDEVVYGVGYMPSERPTMSVQGVSTLRAKMVSFIADCELTRPQYNLARRDKA
jgi:hypothetical protein